jgi:hypothetical protein
MKLRDEAVWKKWEASNRDGGYGEAILDFSTDWADLMEEGLASGADLEEIAEQASYVAAKKHGITGFQYGASVSILASCWEHGEELRRWHNLNSQIHDEGEKANESGGVLNPALMVLK